MIKGVIFDLGSTLIRFDGDWLEARTLGAQAMVEQLRVDGLNLDEHAFTQAFFLVLDQSYRERDSDYRERTTASLLHKILQDLGIPSVCEDVATRALVKFYAVSEASWKPMPDVHNVLAALRASGKRLGLISNAGDDANVQRLLDSAQLREYFDPILVSAAIGIRKPDPRLFQMVLEQWNLPARAVVMVGDLRGTDVLGAQRAGMHQIWLRRDDHSPDRDQEDRKIVPELSAQDLTEVRRLIENLETTSA
jgi:putative hydrolase of the HAD superfamily